MNAIRVFLVSFGFLLFAATPIAADSITYDYDELGRLKSVVYDDGSRIDYTYDNEGNRTSRVVAVPLFADLSVAVADSPDPVVEGNNVTYAVTVSNLGPDGASNVTLAAVLPANTTLVSATPSQGTCDAVVNCSLGSIASAGNATVNIIVTANASGSISYPMSVSAAEGDPVAANNSATATTTVDPPPSADLSIAVADSPDPVVVGNNVTYAVTVSNLGPDAASNVSLAALLPANTTLVSATPSQGTCDAVVNCSLGTVASAGNATVNIIVTADASGSISYPMSVSATEADPVAANNSVTVPTTVDPLADLSVAVADSSDPVIHSASVTYSVTVTNAGPDSASNVSLDSTLAATFSVISATPSQGTCDLAGDCSLGAIASSANATVAVQGIYAPAGVGLQSYTGSVSADEADSNSANNSDTETTTVTNPAEVFVDELDANTSQSGPWKVSTDAASYLGQSLWVNKSASFRWTPNLSVTGTYQVYAWWVHHGQNSSAAPYEISHAGGTDTVNVDQSNAALEGQWNLLGTYQFNAGSTGWIELTRPGGRVSADAVRLLQVQ